MKILVTGSAGRIGRAIYIKLMQSHDVSGFDRIPCSTADYIGDIRDASLVSKAVEGVDVIIHAAALHAPHVALMSNDEFESINIKATESLALQGIQAGIRHFIFTSTTALYGYASTSKGIAEGVASWIDEQVTPQPKSVYHTSKIAAENLLEQLAAEFNLPVTVLQISRCFPEPADLMSVYRLTRGIDARDVASAHQCAVVKRLEGFRRFIISGHTPFNKLCCRQLYQQADRVIKEYAPELAAAFEQRGWNLPQQLDRVYDSAAAQHSLDWRPAHGFSSVLDMLDNEIAEVLPVK
ncbi:NAD-dependent epimerase/dehydratase family protein [Endozoicomonadaceae bacterium StTr2]